MQESTKAWLSNCPNIPEVERLLEITLPHALILLMNKLRLGQGK